MLSVAFAVSVFLLSAGPAKASGEDLAAYREARSRVGRDAESQIKLALWCETHGLNAERMEHLAIAIAADPSNAVARGLMGLISEGGRWRKPDEVAAKAKVDADLANALAEYAEKRDRSPKTAAGHWRLALWCEEKGLKAEAHAAPDGLRPARSGSDGGVEEARVQEGRQSVGDGRTDRRSEGRDRVRAEGG